MRNSNILKLKKLAAGIVGAVGLSAGNAMAAVPLAATDAMTAIGTDAQTLIDTGWGPALIITGGLIALKLFKKVANRAS